jgi:hypothetical protein
MNKTLEVKTDDQQQEEDKALAIWDLGSPLYDSHEVVSLAHLIERHLMTLPSPGELKGFSPKKISQASVVDPAAILVSNTGSKSETKRVRSSKLNTLSEFVRRKLRIKKKIGSRRRKDNSEEVESRTL